MSENTIRFVETTASKKTGTGLLSFELVVAGSGIGRKFPVPDISRILSDRPLPAGTVVGRGVIKIEPARLVFAQFYPFSPERKDPLRFQGQFGGVGVAAAFKKLILEECVRRFPGFMMHYSNVSELGGKHLVRMGFNVTRVNHGGVEHFLPVPYRVEAGLAIVNKYLEGKRKR